MSRRRRILSMVTASIAVVGLGFVVAVSASSRPGQADEPWLDLNFNADIDLTPVMAWVLLIAAVVGAVLFALALREAKPPDEKRGRSVLGILLGIVAFVVILRFLRPFAETVLVDAGESSESVVDASDGTGGSSLGWLFSILVAAVVAAALTRIGLSIRATDPPFEEPAPVSSGSAVAAPVAAAPREKLLGDDPRSRVINAYGSFEDGAARRGSSRLVSETETRHARRATDDLGLAKDDVTQLLAHQNDARYGDAEPTEQEADSAQEAAQRLLGEMDQ